MRAMMLRGSPTNWVGSNTARVENRVILEEMGEGREKLTHVLLTYSKNISPGEQLPGRLRRGLQSEALQQQALDPWKRAPLHLVQ